MATVFDSDEGIAEILRHFIGEKQLINDDSPFIDIFDIDYFKARMASLTQAFPEDFFLHALALKGNSLRGVLRVALESGMGGECASLPEALHALSVGFAPHKVVFDSPCKTKNDIQTALEAGIIMNLDNEHEVKVVDDLLKIKDFPPTVLGIRINPVVGEGSIAMMSTASKLSKFGVPLVAETKDRILDLYQKYTWLNGIHFHVGSQGVPIELFVNAAKVFMNM